MKNKTRYSGIKFNENYDLILHTEKGHNVNRIETGVNLKEIIKDTLKEMLDELSINYEESTLEEMTSKILKLHFRNSDTPCNKVSLLALIMRSINSFLEFYLKENFALSIFNENVIENGSHLYMTIILDLKKIIKMSIENQRIRLLSVYCSLFGKKIKIDLPELKYLYTPNKVTQDEFGDYIINDEFLNIKVKRNS